MANPQATARTLRKHKRRRCPTINPTVQTTTLGIRTVRKPRLRRGRHEQRRPLYVQIDRGESFPVSDALSILKFPWELATNSHASHFTWRSATVNKGCSPKRYRREARRRRECSRIPNLFGVVQRSDAPSATENLASSGTTPGELPSVQRSARIASRPARRKTADGYTGFRPPDKQLQ
jgi:hypothetical protein